VVREWWFELNNQGAEYYSNIVRMLYGVVVREWWFELGDQESEFLVI